MSALEAFGAAMRRSLGRGEAPAGAAAILATTPSVAAADPAQPALDLTDRGWPGDMAARIERLRDTADAASTSIRVVPDALGPVRIAVRREGDAVHVHLAAAQPETQQLLAAAQPQLAAAADARGLGLGRTEVGADSTDAGSDARPQQHAPAPVRPLRPTPAASAATDPTDPRLA